MPLSPKLFFGFICLGPLSLLAGCSSSGSVNSSSPGSTPALASGNWQFSSSDKAAARLSAVSGELSTSSGKITGILHAQSASACIAPASSFEVSGSANSKGTVTLSGSIGGGTLSITGALASDGRSITDATYDIAGGTCAFATPATAKAQTFTPVTGTYVGTFVDNGGDSIAVTATLSQSPQSDTDGNYTLSGSASFGANPCFVSPTAVAAAQVTGGTFTMSYPDSTTQNSVTASGTFSEDATTLTVSNWTLTGPCGPDSGSNTVMQLQPVPAS